MFSLYGLLLTVQILSSLTIIGLVLLQHGKGADMGSSLGGGSSSGVFGARGPANVLAKATKWAAIVFFVVTCMLAYFSSNRTVGATGGVMDSVVVPPSSSSVPAVVAPVPEAPAAPATNPASTVPAAPAATTSSVPTPPPAQ